MGQDNVEDSKDNVWFYEEGGVRKGGISEIELIDLIQAGKLGYGSVVWRKGFPEWIPLENTELKNHLSAPPPLTGMHINNTLLWILAFAPIIGTILEWALAYTIHNNSFSAGLAMKANKYWFISLGLNIGLCYYDERRLKNAGIDTAKFKGWIWLVPVYIFQRTKILKQKYPAFIVWIVCFIFVIIDSV